MKLTSYLIKNRHGTYCLRIRRAGKESRLSLGTKDPETAKIAAYKFGLSVQAMPKKSELQISTYSVKFNADGSASIETDGTKEDHEAAMKALAALRETQPRESGRAVGADEILDRLVALTNKQNQPRFSRQLGQAVEDYLTERETAWAPKTFSSYKGCLRDMATSIGKTKPLAEITREDFVAWRKKYIDVMASKTISTRVSCVEGFVNWAIVMELLNQTFVVRQSLTPELKRQIAERKEPSLPFSAADLGRIFDTQQTSRPDLYLLPILGLLTGARIGELAQLRLCDVQDDGRGGLLFDINWKAGRLKNDHSERVIPVHQIVSDLLKPYIADVRRCWPHAERLFPGLTPDKTNGWANRPGKDLNNAWGWLETGKAFHSFRHTFITMLDRAGAHYNLARRYVGHATVSAAGQTDVHAETYTHAESITVDDLRQVISAVDLTKYPGFTMPDFKYTTGMFDDYFKRRQHKIAGAAARKARAERTPKSKKSTTSKTTR